MMSGWSRHPQCYNQKACVLDRTDTPRGGEGSRDIVCTRAFSQDTDTAKLRTVSHEGWFSKGWGLERVGGEWSIMWD